MSMDAFSTAWSRILYCQGAEVKMYLLRIEQKRRNITLPFALQPSPIGPDQALRCDHRSRRREPEAARRSGRWRRAGGGGSGATGRRELGGGREEAAAASGQGGRRRSGATTARLGTPPSVRGRGRPRDGRRRRVSGGEMCGG